MNVVKYIFRCDKATRSWLRKPNATKRPTNSKTDTQYLSSSLSLSSWETLGNWNGSNKHVNYTQFCTLGTWKDSFIRWIRTPWYSTLVDNHHFPPFVPCSLVWIRMKSNRLAWLVGWLLRFVTCSRNIKGGCFFFTWLSLYNLVLSVLIASKYRGIKLDQKQPNRGRDENGHKSYPIFDGIVWIEQSKKILKTSAL